MRKLAPAVSRAARALGGKAGIAGQGASQRRGIGHLAEAIPALGALGLPIGSLTSGAFVRKLVHDSEHGATFHRGLWSFEASTDDAPPDDDHWPVHLPVPLGSPSASEVHEAGGLEPVGPPRRRAQASLEPDGLPGDDLGTGQKGSRRSTSAMVREPPYRAPWDPSPSSWRAGSPSSSEERLLESHQKHLE